MGRVLLAGPYPLNLLVQHPQILGVDLCEGHRRKLLPVCLRDAKAVPQVHDGLAGFGEQLRQLVGGSL